MLGSYENVITCGKQNHCLQRVGASAGLKTRIIVEFVAMEMGVFTGVVMVRSEINKFTVPVAATVTKQVVDDSPVSISKPDDDEECEVSSFTSKEAVLQAVIAKALEPVILDENRLASVL